MTAHALELPEPRSDEEDLMQTRSRAGNYALWHRRIVGSVWRTTACGLPVTFGEEVRCESLTEELCPVCFTPEELRRSEILNAGGTP